MNRKRYIAGIVVLGILCAGCILKIEAAMIQKGIACEVIRFHVLADSDEENDQRIKMKVKERVVEYMAELLENSQSAKESKEVILQHLEQIEQQANKILKKENSNQEATAEFVNQWFPEKMYGDCTFPAGIYEALQIKIGHAEGKNWWCVLYPGLCFEESVRGVVTEDGKEQLKHVLTEEELLTVLKEGKVKIRFRWF